MATKNTVEASFPNTKVLTFVADSTDEKAVNTAFQTVGHVDILVNNAAFMAELVPIAESEPSSWWKGYEINVLGGYVVTRAFLQVAAAEDAVLVNITSAAVHIAPTSGYSSYQPSKLASTKFFDIVAVENPGIRVINVHPGVIETLPGNMSLDAGAPFPIDEGGFLLLSQPTFDRWSRDCSSSRANDCHAISLTSCRLRGLGSESGSEISAGEARLV